MRRLLEWGHFGGFGNGDPRVEIHGAIGRALDLRGQIYAGRGDASNQARDCRLCNTDDGSEVFLPRPGILEVRTQGHHE